MIADIQFVSCDLCGSSEYVRLFGRENWGDLCDGDYALVQCSHCGLIYLNPRPSKASIINYYPDDYLPYQPAIEEENFRLMRWVRRIKLQRRRKFVEAFVKKKDGNLLDVGCSTGLFLDEMKRNGWNVLGVEISKMAVGYARQAFAVNVFHGYLEDANLPKASFDVITYWDVLEHVTSVTETLILTNRLLVENGIVIINIPNWASLDRKIFGPYWIGLDPPRHMFVFRHELLERYLRESGFEPLKWSTIIHPYYSFIISLVRGCQVKFPKIAGSLDRILNFPGVRFIFEPYFALLSIFRLGGVITLVARKTSSL